MFFVELQGLLHAARLLQPCKTQSPTLVTLVDRTMPIKPVREENAPYKKQNLLKDRRLRGYKHGSGYKLKRLYAKPAHLASLDIL